MSLLLLLRSAAAAPVAPTTPTVVPVPTIEIDFTGNPTATYADIHTTQDGGVSFWRMNSTTTFLDERLNNNGTIIGTPTTTASPYTYDTDLALQFDGSSDGAYVPSSTGLTNKSDMTIQGWMRVDSLPASSRDIVAKRGAWVLALASTGKLTWTLKDDTSTATVTSNTILTVNTWYHVAAVYDSSRIYIYINGVLDNSTAYSSGWEASSAPIRFAQTPSGAVPTYQSTQTATGVGSSNMTITKPASTASGDLLIAHFHIGWVASVVIGSVPAGWALLGYITNSGSGQVINTYIYYKIAGASEPASYTWVNSGGNPSWVGTVSRITGVDSLNPIPNPVWGLATSGTSHATAAHTPNVDNNMVLAFFSIEASTSWTESSGTERYETGSGSNTAAMSSQTQASAASIAVTGTSADSDIGAAFWVAVAGASPAYATVSLDDWSFSNVARSASDLARDYASRSSGEGTWTNVSTSARSLDVQGASRQYELDSMEAGTSTVVLRDSNRSFDPANGSSPYAPNVIPERRIRGRTTYESTTYDLFYNYIERWPTDDTAPGWQEVPIRAVDGFDGLALSRISGTLDAGYSGAQIHRLLDKALWPRTKRSIDTGQYVMAGGAVNADALGLIRQIADSERGIFFIDQAGVATFHDSAHRGSFPRSTASQATFSDTGTTGIKYQDFAPSFDKDKIVNHWTVSPDSSTFAAAEQEQEDPASIAQYFRRSQSRSTRLASNADALSQAGNLLNETAQPGYRYDSITVIPTTASAYHTCLGLTISDRVTVVRGGTQKWVGSTITKDCFIEAKKISAQGGNPWVFTFALSPVSLGNYYSTIMRDGPVSYWRMDSIV